MATSKPNENAEAAKAEDQKAESAGKYVRYTGPADVRVIEARHFKSAGVDNQDSKVEWNIENGRKIPVSSLSPEALALVLEDSNFKVGD